MACESCGTSITRYKYLKKTFVRITIAILFSIGCGGFALAAQPAPTAILAPTWTFRPPPSPTETATASPTFLPTDTATASPSPTAPPTDTITPSPEPQWSIQGPGEILAPILLYHQIGDSLRGSQYYVTQAEFERQMFLLHAWGYHTITVKELAIAILVGAELPRNPIVLSFDDGNENTYSTAFPILQKYGFKGTSYIVYNYVGAKNFMTKDQIRELYEAGWEIGSHSISHVDLTKRLDRQEDEIIESRRKLQILLDVPISTFAYPYGAYDHLSLYYMNFAGYLAAAGLGADMHQGPNNLYYLYRRDINATHDLKTFAQFLPWQGDLENLPAITPPP
jgi:peptidoglycan/xylan/chitin deacetylase (PgdA/CDA1 family)